MLQVVRGQRTSLLSFSHGLGISRHFFCSKQPKSWKVLFFGTDELSVTVLQSIYAHKDLVSDISVICPPDDKKQCHVKRFAKQKQIDFYQPSSEELKTFQLPKTKNGEPFDIGVVASYGNLIPEHIINSLPYKSLNMHPSYLPFYKGPAPLIRQLECGDRVGGISIIELHPRKFDQGRSFLQWVYNIPSDITCKEFEEAVSNHGSHAVVRVLEKYDYYTEKLSSHPDPSDPIIVNVEIPKIEENQKHLFNESASSKLESLSTGTKISPQDRIDVPKRPTYARMLKSADGNVDWNVCTPVQVYNKWRAFSRKPGLFTFITWPPNSTSVRRVKLLKIEPPSDNSIDNKAKEEKESSQSSPGEVSFTKGSNSLVIQTGAPGKVVLCSSIQAEGKKPQTAEGFFNGYLSAFPQRKTVFHSQNITNNPKE